MSLLTSADNAQLAQEVVVTTLRSVFQLRGSQLAFAQKVGISPVHLSYVLNGKRMPSLKLARRLSELMPLSAHDRHTWFEYVEQYWHRREALAQEVQRIADDDLDTALLEVMLTHRQARYGMDPAQVRIKGVLTLSLAENLLSVFPIRSNSTAYLELCSLVYEMHTTLAHHVKALGIAKHMQFVADAFRPTSLQNNDAFESQEFNALRLEIVSLNQLGLAQEAYNQSMSLAANKVSQGSAAHLKPVLCWDCMNAMARLPRSSIREARNLAQEAWAVNERTSPSDWAPFADLLISRSLAEVCISHGSYREAESLLQHHYETLGSVQHLGLVHRVMFLKTYARLLWEQPKGDIDQWRRVIQEAVRIAGQAGLTNELSELQQQYGDQIANI